jgi:hypothetical protein
MHSIGRNPPPPPEPPDLSREQVIAIYRDAETDALKRHTALVGSDGAGTLYVICGCELQFNIASWEEHLKAVVRWVRESKRKR